MEGHSLVTPKVLLERGPRNKGTKLCKRETKFLERLKIIMPENKRGWEEYN